MSFSFEIDEYNLHSIQLTCMNQPNLLSHLFWTSLLWFTLHSSLDKGALEDALESFHNLSKIISTSWVSTWGFVFMDEVFNCFHRTLLKNKSKAKLNCIYTLIWSHLLTSKSIPEKTYKWLVNEVPLLSLSKYETT